MSTKFQNLENSKTCDVCKLRLNISDRINLQKRDNFLAPSNLSVYYT